MISNKLKAIAAESSKKLLSKPGVTGVGAGKKMVDGISTAEDAVLVFVRQKHNINAIRKYGIQADIVPDEIDGVQTDIIEVGDIQLHRGYRARSRPVRPGYSISHRNVTAGTIGGLFYDGDGDVVALSNFHVLANDGKAKIGDVIYQPGIADASGNLDFTGWSKPYDRHAYIGTLKRFYPLDSTKHHTHDSAIAKIYPELVTGGYIDTAYPHLGQSLIGFSDVDIGDTALKCGRTTGFTNGRIIATGATFQIGYDFGLCTLTNVTLTSAMSEGGDSGSLGLDKHMNAFGLLFAGSPKVTLYNDIQAIVDYYGLTPIHDTCLHGMRWGGLCWRTATTDGIIAIADDQVVFTDNANHHCYIENNPPPFNRIKITVNTGSDNGATWGIGAGLIFPNLKMRLNLRFGGTYGAYVDGAEEITIGKTLPNTIYHIEFARNKDFWIGSIEGPIGKSRLIAAPVSQTGLHPTYIRIGKMGINHGPVDYAAPDSPNSGAVGISRAIYLEMD